MKHLLNLVGLSHRPENVRHFASYLHDGQDLLLVREPSNPHDPNAIQVYVHIGYVKAKGQASMLAPKMDAGIMKVPIMDASVVEARGTYITMEVEEIQLQDGERREETPEPESPIPCPITKRPCSSTACDPKEGVCAHHTGSSQSASDDEIPF